MNTPVLLPAWLRNLGCDLGYNATEIRQGGALFRPASGGIYGHFSSQAFCREGLYADGCGIMGGQSSKLLRTRNSNQQRV
jgi:hypothetical protein